MVEGEPRAPRCSLQRDQTSRLVRLVRMCFSSPSYSRSSRGFPLPWGGRLACSSEPCRSTAATVKQGLLI
eukprot:767756-Hanusia_phi.AAC.2